MPVTRTAKKALRQNVRRRAKNVAQMADLKKAIKTYKKAAVAKNADAATAQLSLVFKKLDKAAKVGLIKKNTASRLKSRLSKKVAAKK